MVRNRCLVKCLRCPYAVLFVETPFVLLPYHLLVNPVLFIKFRNIEIWQILMMNQHQPLEVMLQE